MQRWRTAAATMAMVCVGGAGIARSADLPASVRESADAGAQKLAIDTYVKAQVDRVLRHEKGASAARDELGRQTEGSQAVTPSASFQKIYVDSVVANIGPLLSDKGILPRLNGGIIVARLCRSTRLSTLTPLAVKVMQDPSPAVALWGVKAAADMLPGEVAIEFNRKKQTLTTAIVACAKSHPDAGVVVQTAYDALYLPDQQPPLDAKAYGPSIDAMNALLSSRVQQYQTGVPSSPQAERLPPVFFVRGVVTGVMTPAQQMAVVQNMVDLLSICAQHTAALPQGDAGTQIVELVKNYAGGLNVLLTALKQEAVAAKFRPMSNIRTPVQTAVLTKQVADAVAAVKTLPGYAALKDPPTTQGQPAE